ncbi:hypothetical protein TNCV_3327831 [Trichonephila clavipes]|nr:hypothetical protein TNCV_3327831 [Trichonephila clavipes]
MGATIPNVLQPGAFAWFQKTQGPLVKMLPLPGWWPMKQLASCTYEFLAMWRYFRRLVCRGRPGSGLRVNDISRIHWS